MRKFEPEFEDKNDFVSCYKNNISYFNIEKVDDVQCLEAYMILTKKFLFIFNLSQGEDYPMMHEQPIKVEEIQTI